MSVSVVNGFVCYSSCDVSKAKQGKDPHPATGPDEVDQEGAPSSLVRSNLGRADQPAVVFGGSLSPSAADSVTAVESAQPANSTELSRSKLAVDLLV
jgi:hypothetical protein